MVMPKKAGHGKAPDLRAGNSPSTLGLSQGSKKSHTKVRKGKKK